MKKIALILPDTSYSPEIFALNDYLNAKGYPSEIVSIHRMLANQKDYCLAYIKMGFIPIWDKKIKIPQIHDYASLSTGGNQSLKNFIKRNLSKKPILRSFLNRSVKEKMNFNDNIPYIYRDMGAESFFFEKLNAKKEYDFCYVGSITDDREVGKVLENFIDSNYTIVLVGDPKIKDLERYLDCKNIVFKGRKDRLETASIIKSAKIGFNYMPDISPWNTQTSTKVIEYLASGLMVASNRYKWMEDFKHQENIVYYEDINNVNLSDLFGLYENNLDFLNGFDCSFLNWNFIFDNSGILEYIKSHLD